MSGRREVAAGAVAIQPPASELENCGRAPSAGLASWASSGAVAPAWMRAARETGRPRAAVEPRSCRQQAGMPCPGSRRRRRPRSCRRRTDHRDVARRPVEHGPQLVLAALDATRRAGGGNSPRIPRTTSRWRPWACALATTVVARRAARARGAAARLERYRRSGSRSPSRGGRRGPPRRARSRERAARPRSPHPHSATALALREPYALRSDQRCPMPPAPLPRPLAGRSCREPLARGTPSIPPAASRASDERRRASRTAARPGTRVPPLLSDFRRARTAGSARLQPIRWSCGGRETASASLAALAEALGRRPWLAGGAPVGSLGRRWAARRRRGGGRREPGLDALARSRGLSGSVTLSPHVEALVAPQPLAMLIGPSPGFPLRLGHSRPEHRAHAWCRRPRRLARRLRPGAGQMASCVV